MFEISYFQRSCNRETGVQLNPIRSYPIIFFIYRRHDYGLMSNLSRFIERSNVHWGSSQCSYVERCFVALAGRFIDTSAPCASQLSRSGLRWGTSSSLALKDVRRRNEDALGRNNLAIRIVEVLPWHHVSITSCVRLCRGGHMHCEVHGIRMLLVWFHCTYQLETRDA